MTDATLQLILQKLETIETDMSEMKNEINGIKDEMAAMKAQLDENTEITKAIHHRQSESDAKLKILSLDFPKLHGDLVATKDCVVELEEGQKSTNEVIREHEVSIRSLRRRPV